MATLHVLTYEVDGQVWDIVNAASFDEDVLRRYAQELTSAQLVWRGQHKDFAPTWDKGTGYRIVAMRLLEPDNAE